MTPTRDTGPTWTLIIPVKETRVAKTRLGGVGNAAREALAAAFAADVVAAALGARRVAETIVVSNDVALGGLLGALGARVLRDEPEGGLNVALAYAAASARAEVDRPVVTLSGDLPAATSNDLDRLLLAATGLPGWFVGDADGTGTTMLGAAAGAPLRPSFGPTSRADHLALGLVDLSAAAGAGLRRDVDSIAHLRIAARLGVGARTTAVLESAELGPALADG